MIQDSRIIARIDGKPPIRVPNCHTYFTPASAECHGLITIVRNNISSKISPTIATTEGTEVLTVNVWIDKKQPYFTICTVSEVKLPLQKF